MLFASVCLIINIIFMVILSKDNNYFGMLLFPLNAISAVYQCVIIYRLLV